MCAYVWIQIYMQMAGISAKFCVDGVEAFMTATSEI